MKRSHGRPQHRLESSDPLSGHQIGGWFTYCSDQPFAARGGTTFPTVTKLADLFRAIDPTQELSLTVAQTGCRLGKFGSAESRPTKRQGSCRSAAHAVRGSPTVVPRSRVPSLHRGLGGFAGSPGIGIKIYSKNHRCALQAVEKYEFMILWCRLYLFIMYSY